MIRSTIDGLILDVPVKAGNSVIMSNTFNDGTTIATVANMNDMIFRGNIDETEVGRIHEQMPIKLTIGALQNLTFNAILEYISPKGVKPMEPTSLKSRLRLPFRILFRFVPDIRLMRKSYYKSQSGIGSARKHCWI